MENKTNEEFRELIRKNHSSYESKQVTILSESVAVQVVNSGVVWVFQPNFDMTSLDKVCLNNCDLRDIVKVLKKTEEMVD